MHTDAAQKRAGGRVPPPTGQLIPFPMARARKPMATPGARSGSPTLRPVLRGEVVPMRLQDGFYCRKQAPCDGFLLEDANGEVVAFVSEDELRAALDAAG